MLFVLTASAHNVAGELVLRPFVRDGALAGVFSSNGLTLRDADGVYRQVCLESLPAPSDAWLEPDGATFLLATADGPVHVGAAGCDAPTPAGDTTDRIIRFLPLGDALYALAYRADGDAILRSDDDGATFVLEPPLPGSDWLVQTLAADADGRLVVGGLAERAPAVAHREAEGFVSDPTPDPAAVFVAALGAGPDGTGAAVATVDETGAARLWATEGDGWAAVLDLPAAPDGYGCLDGACFVATPGALYRWDPALGAGSLAVVDGPTRCLLVADGALWGCRDRLEASLVDVTYDALAFTPVLATDAALPRDCVADACALPTGTTTGPVAEQPITVEPRCGCAPVAPAPWAFLAGLVARRRRLRASPG